MQLNPDPKDHPATLFKFCAPERADILEGLKIRFTQPAVFNDIFEAFPGADASNDYNDTAERFSVAVELEITRHPEWSRRERREFERRKFRELESWRKSEKAKSTRQRLCEEFQIRYSAVSGVLCVSTKWDNILMWSHYTDDHKGFVIQFDGTHGFFDGVVKVCYSDKRPLLENTAGRNSPDIFYTKSTDWQYEDEYRKSENFGKSQTLLPNGNTFVEFPPLSEIDQTNWPVHLVDVPAAAIRKVIFGHRITADTKSRLLTAFSADQLKHVRHSQARPHPKLFQMEETTEESPT